MNGGIRGFVRDVRYRSEVSSSGMSDNRRVNTSHILTFRIETPGYAPVPVQMRGPRIEGTLTDGDEVWTDKLPRPGKVLKLKVIENLTTGVPVDVRMPLWAKILAVPFFIVLFGIFAFVGYNILQEM